MRVATARPGLFELRSSWLTRQIDQEHVDHLAWILADGGELPPRPRVRSSGGSRRQPPLRRAPLVRVGGDPPPLFLTAGEAKARACGRQDASKDDVEAAMRAHFGAIWDACLVAVAKGKRENAYDAAAVALAAWDRPEVAALRRIGSTR